MRESWTSHWLGAPLDREDAARLWMDTPQNPMIVTALLRLDGPLDFATFTERVEAAARARDRLRARIVTPRVPFLRPRWREEREASIAHHVDHVRLAPGSGDEQLAEVLSRIASEPLDRDRPLWRMWLVDGEGGRSAIAVRIHHAIADGVALLGVLYGFSDEGVGAAPAEPEPAAPAPPAARRSSRDLVRGAVAIARLLARPADAPAALSGRPAGRKALAWSAPFDVASIRSAAHRAGAHLNDVILGALAGALRVLVAQGGAPPRSAVHALVPVALPHEVGAMGNRYASLFVRLPVDVGGAIERVTAARDAMHEARATAGLQLGRSLVGAAFALREHAERIGVRLLSRKASLVVSNLAGPTEPTLHVAGRRITSIVFASPMPGSVALSASVFSYGGELRVTIAVDTAVLPDPWPLVRLLEIEMRATLAALLGTAAGTA